MVEPMTAAEYRRENLTAIGMFPGGWSARILAALKERERLLGERAEWLTATGKALNEATTLGARVTELEAERRDWSVTAAQQIAKVTQEVAPLKADASLGALVRRIREHPEATRGHSAFVYTHNGTWTTAWTERGLQHTLAYLDSLLPKEPEVAPSGWTYERSGEHVRQIDHEGGTLTIRRADSDAVPPCDREFVARLMEGVNAK